MSRHRKKLTYDDGMDFHNITFYFLDLSDDEEDDFGRSYEEDSGPLPPGCCKNV